MSAANPADTEAHFLLIEKRLEFWVEREQVEGFELREAAALAANAPNTDSPPG